CGALVAKGQRRATLPHAEAVAVASKVRRPIAAWRLKSRGGWWPRPDSNRHSGFPEADFKSAVSTVPPRGPRVGAHPDRAQWDALHQLLSGACSCRRTGTHFAGTCAAVLALAARVLEADKLRVPPVRHAAPHPG